jgi:hypothetical protein
MKQRAQQMNVPKLSDKNKNRVHNLQRSVLSKASTARAVLADKAKVREIEDETRAGRSRMRRELVDRG